MPPDGTPTSTGLSAAEPTNAPAISTGSAVAAPPSSHASGSIDSRVGPPSSIAQIPAAHRKRLLIRAVRRSSSTRLASALAALSSSPSRSRLVSVALVTRIRAGPASWRGRRRDDTPETPRDAEGTEDAWGVLTAR